jgi:hypothetical protein
MGAFENVAQRLYHEESRGIVATAAASRIAHDPAIGRAVRAGDARALRAAALHDLYAPGHVVRIAVRGGGVSTDVGGPFVVAQQQRSVAVGRRHAIVDTAIQDIAGYAKLINRQTGLDAVIKDYHGHVYSTIPGGARMRLPDSGVTTVRGRARLVRSFTERGWNGELLLVRIIGPAA